MASDEHYMAVAMELAERGRGTVEPNPMVGAVIVYNNTIIAQGWHRRFGGPHAEADALAAAQAAKADVHGATLYVTLEPCCHTNKKTPPCTNAIIAAGLTRVVVAMEDPDVNVRGRGIAQLRDAGIEVATGVLAARAHRLLGPYIKLRKHGRPWVICKWAQTADGYLAQPAGQERWISSETSRADVHLLRGRCDGILIGVGTALADDPLLTNRSAQGQQPTRVVLDSQLRLRTDSQLVRSADKFPLLVATVQSNAALIAPLKKAGVEVLCLPADTNGRVNIAALLDELGRRQWTWLLIEGGAQILAEFIHAGLADELCVYISPRTLGHVDAKLPHFQVDDVLGRYQPFETQRAKIGGDTRIRCWMHNPATP